MVEHSRWVRYPTPVVSGKAPGLHGLWIKNDGLSGSLYGGNKIRKLERILPQAERLGARRLLTAGAAGSHHVLATTVIGRRSGFRVAALLWPQPWSEHAEATLRAACAQGLEPIPVRSLPAAVAGLVLEKKTGDFVIPIGGFGREGVLAHATAVREIADEVRLGNLPEPRVVVVAVGTGTTAAGLLAGLEVEGLHTRVIGVAVARNPAARALVLGMAGRALMAMGRGDSFKGLSGRLSIDSGRVGRGYGHPTPTGIRATEIARQLGIRLDPTYTAKAFGRALEEARTEPATAVGATASAEPAPRVRTSTTEFSAEPDRPRLARPEGTLYWHTLSAVPLGPLLESDPSVTDPVEVPLFLFTHRSDTARP